MPKLYNVSEVGEMLGLSKSCIYKKAEKGEMDAIKIGNALRFTEDNIRDFINKCKKTSSIEQNQKDENSRNTSDFSNAQERDI